MNGDHLQVSLEGEQLDSGGSPASAAILPGLVHTPGLPPTLASSRKSHSLWACAGVAGEMEASGEPAGVLGVPGLQGMETLPAQHPPGRESRSMAQWAVLP